MHVHTWVKLEGDLGLNQEIGSSARGVAFPINRRRVQHLTRLVVDARTFTILPVCAS